MGTKSERRLKLSDPDAIGKAPPHTGPSAVSAESILRDLTEPLIAFDNEWRIAYANREAGRVAGMPTEELLGKVAWDLWPAVVGTELESECRRAMDARVPVKFEYSVGDDAWFEISANPSEPGITVHGRDISQRKRAEHNLLNRENELSDFLENSATALHWVGPDGTILWANEAELQLVGCTREEYVGHNIAEFHVDEEVICDILQRLRSREELRDCESRIRRKDGSVRYVSITSNVLWEGGKFIHTRCFTRDITDQKIAQQLEHHLASIVESSDDAIVSKDLNGIIRSWNRGAQQLFGYTPEEVVGKPISMLAAPGYGSEIPRILERIARGERTEHYETKRQTKDGRILTVSLTVSPIRDASGRIVGASKVARDITEQTKATEAQERLAAIVESSDDAIISKDLNGIIRSWNRGAERTFGYKAEEAIGQHISILAVPERSDEMPNILERISRGERIDHYVTKRRTKDGRVLSVSLTVSPVRDASGRIVGASKVARDMTEREQHQQALREANAALKRSNADLEQFAYSASHDLQEPLRMVATYTELLRKKFGQQLGERGDEYIRYAVEGALRMERLIKDLLAFTQASSLGQEPTEWVDANDVVDDVLANLATAIADSNATVTRDTLPAVRIHKFQLQQLFQNLIGNAIRYRGADPPRIHVGVGRSDGEWVFSVQDNGIGIDQQYKEQVFGIFKRLHSAAEYPGTGMGLAICQRIVQRAGGRIWVESELGRGSTFFFTLAAEPGS